MNHFYMIALILCYMGVGINAQTVIQVAAGDSTLRLAVESASDGDILELISSGGVYSEPGTDKVVVDKTLTIRAADGLADMPIVRNTFGGTTSARLFEIQDGCDLLTLQGLFLDGRMMDGGDAHAKNAVRGRDINVPEDSIRFSLKIEDCEMRYYTEAIVKLHANNSADSVIVRNSIFDETRNEGLLLRESSSAGGPNVENVEVSNTTFTRIGREAIYIEFSDPVVTINHCTFDSISWRENKRMVYPRDVTDVTITNSIFTNQGGTQSAAIALYGNSTISYCDTFQIAGFSLNGNASVGAGMLGVDPLYTDPLNDDYTLDANSPVLGMANDGRAMGDLRWEPVNTDPVIYQVAAGDSTLRLAVEAASSGDTIELITSGGIYSDSGTDKVVVDKTLTIRAADGLPDMPIVRNTFGGTTSARLFEIQDGCDLLTLQGLFLDGRMMDGGAAHAKNAVRGRDINVPEDSIRFSLKIEDCEMRYYTEAIVKLHANNSADSVIVRNCIFDETRNEGLLLRESSSAGGPNVDNVEVSNTTFTRIGREAIYIEFSDPVVTINHCTFDSISWRENKRMVYPRDVTDVTITNSIFTNQGGTQSAAIALYGNSTISYCDTFQIAGFSLNGNASVGAGMLGVDPLYTDPLNDDYTLDINSPVLGMADDGRAMGDLRWEPVNTDPVIYQVAAGDSTLRMAVAGASDGDTIELITSGGIYSDSGTDKVIVNKKLTVRAAAGLAEKPIVRNTNPATTAARLFEIQEGGELVLQGLCLDGRMMDGGPAHAKNAVRSQDINDPADAFRFQLKIEDCEMRYYTESIVKAHANTAADSVILRNCILDEAQREGILLRENTASGGPDIGSLEVTNTTFTKIGREAIYIEFSDPVVRITHCTFDSISYAEDKRIIYPRDVTDVQIKNCILSNQGGSIGASIRLYGNSTISYTDTFNVGAFSLEGNSSVGAGMLGVDPQYNNPAEYDYRLASLSPLRGAGDDGRAMGDLRWEAFPETATLTVSTTGNGSVELDPPGGVYDIGSDVTLTAVPDTGWVFFEWQGALTGSNNPEILTITDDAAVTAVFQLFTGIGDGAVLPEEFAVSRNYPNPFNPTTTIKFQVPQVSSVSLVVYNILGHKVRTLVNSSYEPGFYQTVWDGRNDSGESVSSGMYLYRFEAEGHVSTQKMLLMK